MCSPLVSVIVPVFNVSSYIDDCINSIVEQSYKNIEILVIDDGSTDGSSAICDRWSVSDDRIKVFHKPNGGLSDARNYGLEHASGEWVSFIDSDDYVSPFFIESLLSAVLTNGCKVAAIPYGSPFKDGEACDVMLSMPSDDSVKVYGQEEVQRLLLYQSMDTAAQWRLYKKELLDPPVFPVGLYYEDLASIYRIIRETDKIAVVNCRKLYAYRLRANGIIRQGYSHIKAESALRISYQLYSEICIWYPNLSKAASSRCFSLCRMVYAQVPSGNEATDGESKDRIALWRELCLHRRAVLQDSSARKRERLAAGIACLGEPFFSLFCCLCKHIGLLR